MLAALAHHLCAARVSFNQHAAHRTLLDRLVAVPGHQVQPVPSYSQNCLLKGIVSRDEHFFKGFL